MRKRFHISIKYITIIYFLNLATLNAQVLHDTTVFDLLKNGVDSIYNFQFNNASEVYYKINESYPGHPIGYLFRGMITYWENYPLLPASRERAFYESDMRKCIELSEKKHDPTDDTEYLLMNLCARGMLLLYYADNGLSMQVIPLATSTYQYVRRSYDYTSAFNDFLFFTGLYDYYREAYPGAYPVYKSLAFLFPKGDMTKGLNELQAAAKSSIVLKAESFSLLSWICLCFENNYEQASYYSKSLHALYPANLQYLAEYIKNLLLVKQYDEAESLILSSSIKTDNSYYQRSWRFLRVFLRRKNTIILNWLNSTTLKVSEIFLFLVNLATSTLLTPILA